MTLFQRIGAWETVKLILWRSLETVWAPQCLLWLKRAPHWVTELQYYAIPKLAFHQYLTASWSSNCLDVICDDCYHMAYFLSRSPHSCGLRNCSCGVGEAWKTATIQDLNKLLSPSSKCYHIWQEIFKTSIPRCRYPEGRFCQGCMSFYTLVSTSLSPRISTSIRTPTTTPHVRSQYRQ